MQVRPFRFGVVGISSPDGAAWTSLARTAERLGYATFLVWDHFGEQFAPIPALAMAAAATTRLRVGTLVSANDYKHPVVLAKEIATLDQLSDGRVELGLGAGWLRAEYEQAGIAFDAPGTRVARLAEAVEVMRGLWAEQPLTFRGEHYAITELNGWPKPAQRPHPPLLLGGARRQMLELAGRKADIVGFATRVDVDGTHHFHDSLPDALARNVAWVQAAAGARFAQLELHIHVGGVVITEDREGVAQQLGLTVGLTASELLACPQALIGTEDEIVADLVRRRAQLGISYITITQGDMEPFAPIVARLADH